MAQALVGDGDVDVRINAVTAVGQLVAAAPGLAAKTLSYLAQALLGAHSDGWGYRSSVLYNCVISIAAMKLISQLCYLYCSFAFCVR